MQKINPSIIISSHLNSLRNHGKLVVSDLLVFYALPLVLGIGFYLLDWRIPKAAVELSITVFSIFAALLLSVQVALYSVSLRKLSPPTDPRKKRAFDVQSSTRLVVIRELNDNISYLILLAVVWVTVLLILFALGCHGRVASAVVFVMLAHFFLTLLMVVKRASIVFSREYEDSVGSA